MAASMTYNSITPAIWSCVQTTSEQNNGTVYAFIPPPAGFEEGTATTSVTLVGTIVLNFTFDIAAQTLTYTIQSKPFIVPEDKIWDGIQNTINGCQGS